MGVVLKIVFQCKQEVDDGMTCPAMLSANSCVKRSWVRIYIYDSNTDIRYSYKEPLYNTLYTIIIKLYASDFSLEKL